jgi:uncharacterized protein YdaU (DUF1376 family)
MHHYPFHPGDYLKDTAHWSEDRTLVEVEAGLLRDLAYRRLLDLYYGEEEPIPSKTRLVAIRIRMLKHEEIVASVLKEKFKLIDGFWRQGRVDETVASYQKRAAASRENGKKGGRPKLTGTQPNLTGSGQVATKNHKPRTKRIPPTPLMGEWFEEWYAEYPAKKARQAALVAFLKLLPDRGMVDTMKAAIKAQVAAGHFTNLSGEEAIPNPASWINGRRWEDTIAAPRLNGDTKHWWDGRSGIVAKGIELGLEAPPAGDDAAWFKFMAGVWTLVGEGPWLDPESRAYPIYKRMLEGE